MENVPARTDFCTTHPNQRATFSSGLTETLESKKQTSEGRIGSAIFCFLSSPCSLRNMAVPLPTTKVGAPPLAKEAFLPNKTTWQPWLCALTSEFSSYGFKSPIHCSTPMTTGRLPDFSMPPVPHPCNRNTKPQSKPAYRIVLNEILCVTSNAPQIINGRLQK